MKKHEKHIINEVAYFKKVAGNMRRKNRIKEKASENHEPFNDDIYIDKNSEQIPMDEKFQKKDC